MPSPEKIHVLLYWGGNILQDSKSVRYDIGPLRIMTISRKINFAQLLSKLYEITGIDKNQFLLKVYTRYSLKDAVEIRHTILPIFDDHNLEFFLDPENEISCLELYVQKEQITSTVVPEIPKRPDCGPHVSPQDTVVGLAAVAEKSGNVGSHDCCANASASGQEAVGVSQHNVEFNSGREQDDDSADAVASDPAEDSSQDLGDGTHSKPEGIVSKSRDKIDIDATSQTPVDCGEGAPTRQQVPADAERLPTTNKRALSPDIPFTPGRQPKRYANSNYTPSAGKFYDQSKGEIHLHMLFKDKDQLQAAVEDYSVRVAKRGYRVTSSTAKFFKVDCKHNAPPTVMCRWFLVASFKENIGLFKITRYGGPHTCNPPEQSIRNGNLNN